ncbi:hypothetical protein ACL9RL_05710 [Plantibacter sp. Mn2098]|uniref:hypothetical protein n=1 Tax=Plantibacter sp. Mn2098 TaxID=3395266 RepID=UPI003BCCD4CA
MLDDTPWRGDAPWIEDDPARRPPIGTIPRRLLVWGIVLAVVGTANQLFDRQVLTMLRPVVDVDLGLEVISIVGRAWTVFGLPLAVGFICLSIALRHLEHRTRPCDGGPHRRGTPPPPS